MRPLLSLALGLLLAAPALALAQDEGSRSFSGTGPDDSRACAAAKADAQAWARRGKSEGRLREIRSLGECTCAPAGDQVGCRVDARVIDEAHEEEEER